MKKYSKQIKTVIDILLDEVKGDVNSALKKMTYDYSMTWVDAGLAGKKLFRSTGKNIRKEMKEAYVIQGRQYEVWNIGEGRGTIFVELVESYPDPKTKKVYRTPLVLVLEMKNRKIRTGRHYLDPRLSYKYLTKSQIRKIFKGRKRSLTIIKNPKGLH